MEKLQDQWNSEWGGAGFDVKKNPALFSLLDRSAYS